MPDPLALCPQEHTLHGLLLRDDEAKAAFVKMHGGSRPPDERGFCMYLPDTHMLHAKCIGALVEPDTEASRASLKEWLPSAERLLHIAKFERYWDIHMTGPAHPSLLAARLHAERLGDWKSALEVARGLLEIRVDVPMQPLVRIEALRLLARARHALDPGCEAACTALEQAVAEAAEVGYVWMEALALRDMLRLEGLSEKQRLWARSSLDATLDKLSASRADVLAVLGLGSG